MKAEGLAAQLHTFCHHGMISEGFSLSTPKPQPQPQPAASTNASSHRPQSTLYWYTDASGRNGLVVSVVIYNRQLYRPKYEVVRQETIRREKTCTVTAAKICAIRAALAILRDSKSSGWIITDSQEALRLFEARGTSAMSGRRFWPLFKSSRV